jgi:hypothetical protein
VQHRPLHAIAFELKRDWGARMNGAAAPYVEGLSEVAGLTDRWGTETGADAIQGFLCPDLARGSSPANQGGAQGDVAKPILQSATDHRVTTVTNPAAIPGCSPGRHKSRCGGRTRAFWLDPTGTTSEAEEAISRSAAPAQGRAQATYKDPRRSGGSLRAGRTGSRPESGYPGHFDPVRILGIGCCDFPSMRAGIYDGSASCGLWPIR